jgi:Ring finger domain
MGSETRSGLVVRFAALQWCLLVTAVQGDMWFTTMSDCSNKTTTTGGDAEMTEPGLENSTATAATTTTGQGSDAKTIVKQVFLILAVGVVMSMLLLIFTYLQLKYCKNCGISGVVRSSSALPQRGGRGQRQRAIDTSLAAQAKLTGMSRQERRDVLEHLFEPCIVAGGDGGASHSFDVEAAAAAAPSHHTTSRNLESYHNNNNDDDHVWEGDDELPKDASCSICLSTLRKNGRVLETPCKHRFHYKCCQEWLQKRDSCPYCRADLFTVDQLRSAALEVLGKDRVEELGAGDEGLCKSVELVSEGSAVTADESAPEAPAPTPSPPAERRDESR